jgi:hypothetical protein
MELFRMHTDAVTGETTKIPYTQKEIDECNNWVDATPQPTKEELLSKLQELQTQIAQLGK